MVFIMIDYAQFQQQTLSLRDRQLKAIAKNRKETQAIMNQALTIANELIAPLPDSWVERYKEDGKTYERTITLIDRVCWISNYFDEDEYFTGDILNPFWNILVEIKMLYTNNEDDIEPFGVSIRQVITDYYELCLNQPLPKELNTLLDYEEE